MVVFNANPWLINPNGCWFGGDTISVAKYYCLGEPPQLTNQGLLVRGRHYMDCHSYGDMFFISIHRDPWPIILWNSFYSAMYIHSLKRLGGEQQKGWAFHMKEYGKIWEITGKKWKNMNNTQMNTFSLNRTDQNNFSSFRLNKFLQECDVTILVGLKTAGSGSIMDMGCSAWSRGNPTSEFALPIC